jgi:hypothetical protein
LQKNIKYNISNKIKSKTKIEISNKIKKRHGYWNEKENQLKFMEYLLNELNIKDWKQWYDIGADDISSMYLFLH